MNKTKKIAAVVALALLLCFAVTGAFAWLEYKTGQLTNTFTIGKIEAELFESATKDHGRTKDTDAAQPEVTANDYKLTPGGSYVKDPTVRIKEGSEPCYVRMFVKVDLRGKSADVLKAAALAYLQQHPEELHPFVSAGYLTENGGTYSFDSAKLLGLIIGWSEGEWTRVNQWYGDDGNGGEVKSVGIVEYRFVQNGSGYTNGRVDASDDDQTLPALFEGFKIPIEVSQGMLDLVVDQFDADNDDEATADELPQVRFIAQAIQAEGFSDANDAWANVAPPADFKHVDTPIVLTLPSFSLPTAPTP